MRFGEREGRKGGRERTRTSAPMRHSNENKWMQYSYQFGAVIVGNLSHNDNMMGDD